LVIAKVIIQVLRSCAIVACVWSGKPMGVEVALALLERDGLWLLQLRDDIEGIVAPGCWGLFGGHLEAGESPEEGLRRELQEEIAYTATSLQPWWRLENDGRVRHFFRGPLNCPLEDLRLLEGQDLALVSLKELRTGQVWSRKLRQHRPLAPSLLQIVARLDASSATQPA
jgi:8-oxo-dGTP diphosphatase